MSSRLFLLSLITCAVSAHDLYILPDAFSVTPKSNLLVAFHNGDAFPESETAPSTARLRDAQLRGAKGTIGIQGLEIVGKRTTGKVVIPENSGNLLLSIRTIPNFIELQPDKFFDYLKEEGLTEVIAWRTEHHETSRPGRERYTKFAKSLLTSGTPDSFYSKVLGFTIEIIPEANPSRLQAGAQLPVQVLFKGKPAADLQLEAAWASGARKETKVIGRTSADGRINVPLAAAGKWRLHTLLMERCAEPAVADWESSWASLTFEIK